MKPEAASFPMAIGLACSWNPQLFQEVYTVIAKEMLSRGEHHVLSPVIDVCRDPRWKEQKKPMVKTLLERRADYGSHYRFSKIKQRGCSTRSSCCNTETFCWPRTTGRRGKSGAWKLLRACSVSFICHHLKL